MHQPLYLLAVICIIIGNVHADCPSDITITNATSCGTIVYWPSLDDISVYDWMIFPLGETEVVLDAGGDCVFNVSVSTAENVTICGEYGSCSSTSPYDCECLATFGDDYCCSFSLVDNTTWTNTSCGSSYDAGSCSPGGVCTCNMNYGGEWCCPIAGNSNEVCNGMGCCLTSGECECDEGMIGAACNVTTTITFEHISSDEQTIAIATGVTVAVVGAVIMAYSVATATASATATAAAAVSSTSALSSSVPSATVELMGPNSMSSSMPFTNGVDKWF